MWIKFNCHCSTRLKTDLLNSQQAMVCPACHKQVVVPFPDNAMLLKYLEPKTIPVPTMSSLKLVEISKRLFGRFLEIQNFAIRRNDHVLLDEIKSETLKFLNNIKIFLNSHAQQLFAPEDRDSLQADTIESLFPAALPHGSLGANTTENEKIVTLWTEQLSPEAFKRPDESHSAASLIESMIAQVASKTRVDRRHES